MTKREIVEENNRVRKKYTNMYVRPIFKALQSPINSFLRIWKTEGEQAAKSFLYGPQMNKELAAVVSRLYVRSGIDMANRTLKRLKREPVKRTMGYSAAWTKQIMNYFDSYLLEKVVVETSQTTRQQIDKILRQAVDEGWSFERMAQELQSPELLKWRALMIARTETGRAINYGVNLGADSYEYKTQKEWISVHDNRVRGTMPEDRADHRGLDGQRVEADGKFTDPRNGETLSFPGDPEASGQSTINCRCTMAVTGKRDSQGALIPKKRPVRRITNRQRATIQDLINAL